jgi:alpha-L-rhamnosidase
MQWLATKTTHGISSVGGFGDWLNAGGGAKSEAIDTAYHA